MLHPKSANSSFGGYPGAAEATSSQSNLHSFQVDATSFNTRFIGTASLGNTQLTTPTVGSFDGVSLSQPEYLLDGGYLADLDWYNMPGCEQVLNEFDFTTAPVELEATYVADVQPPIDWHGVTNLSSSFPSQGISQ